MALLTDRQRTAQALAKELLAMGAWVINPLPLDDNAKLRFQVMDVDRDRVIEKLSSWDWSPTLVGFHPRITSRGMEAATLYEINLPADTPAVPAYDRKIIPGELAERQKMSVEVEALRKYLGWDK
jgi:hypothetical protein